jgi:hypothetical protein
MRLRMKQGRLPFGLPRTPRSRSPSAYAAFHRVTARKQDRGDATSNAAQCVS